MAVFKNISNGYEIDFSEVIAEQLEELWDNNRNKFEELREYIYERFDWVYELCTNAPILFEHFADEKTAQKCDIALSKEIHKWLKKYKKEM